jgi:hypothetical protein
MTNPTTNFGWQMPTATDLVTDLPADFEVFGQAVDTDFVDLLGGANGYILSKASATDLDFAWIPNDQGDITAVNVTAPITGGGSSGAVTIGVSAASTAAAGVVQLSDSTSTTSSVLASTPTATKSAYDLADAAIAKSTVTTAGDIIYRNATVPVRLGIGTAGQVLKVNSGATAPEWGAAGAATFNTGTQAVTTTESTTSTSFVNLTTTQSVTVTTGTKALVLITALLQNGASGNPQPAMTFSVSGATTRGVTAGELINFFNTNTVSYNLQFQTSGAFLVTGLTAGSNVFTAKFAAQQGGTAYFSNRIISVIDMGS